MSVQVAISVFQREKKGSTELLPICSGLFAWSTSSRDAAKAKEKTLDRLRREIPKLPRELFQRLFVPASRKLERVHLELKLTGEGEKKHVAGWFPMIVESHVATSEHELRIAYHPFAPQGWFELHDDEELAAQAQRMFARTFGFDSDFDAMRSHSKDKLVTLRFDVEPPSLLDLLTQSGDGRELLGLAGGGQLDELLRVSINHSARAVEGRLRAGLPREPLRRRLQQLLCGPEKSSVLVVGAPGSGKSTLIARLVHDLLEFENFPSHRNLDRVHNVIGLRGRHVIAGMSYVGQWEARAVALLERAKKRRLIFWADDVHAWGSIGKTNVSERTLADFFRGPLSRREVVVIGECTPQQASLFEHEAPALASTFVRVNMNDIGEREALGMMLHESRRLEAELDVAFDPRSFRRVLDLGRALSTGRALPGKALDPLTTLAKSRASAKTPETRRLAIEPEHVVELFSRQTGLPNILLGSERPLSKGELERELGQQIMGQPVALDAACDLVLGIRANLCATGRPYGVYLFTGPTGTGKTELAKCIAEYLYGDGNRLVRFDMGELNLPDATSRLIGDHSAPNGLLTRAVRAQPFCVLLLDEIEKAHRSVLNLLLQIFDDGRLTDANGSLVDFTHTVIVMTSNLGTRERTIRGFAEDPGRVNADVAKAVRDFFPPELFNRIDRVVPFTPLDRDAARRIAQKELARLAARPGLAERNVFVRFTDAVIERVVDDGYSFEHGARALKRYIDRNVGETLTRALTKDTGAEMRLLWLYRPEQGVGVHSEALVEAEPVHHNGEIAALLAAPAEELVLRVPEALARLRTLRTGPRMRKLEGELRGAVDGYRAGEQDRADHAYHLDQLRAHLGHLERRLEARVLRSAELQELERKRKRTAGEELGGGDFTTLGDAFGKLRDRREGGLATHADRALVGDLIETRFVERVLERAHEPSGHVVLLDVQRLAAHHERRRFSRGNPGLLEWLVRAYASARGRLDSACVLSASGTLQRVTEKEALFELLAERPRQVTLRIAGPGVFDFLRGETGCHVRRAIASGPEIVRVVASVDTRDPETFLREHEARRREFEAALESEGTLPENPDSLLPVVRSVRWDPPETGAAAAWIEDYRLSHVASRRVRELGELLSEFLLLGTGVE